MHLLRTALFATVALLLISSTSAGWFPCAKEPGKEYPPVDEDAALKQMIATVTKHQQNQIQNKTIARRFFHAKDHGCISGTLSVLDDIPARFRHGVFARPGHSYSIYGRFSNGLGTPEADSFPDIRGFAFAVQDVAGERLLDDESSDQVFIQSSYERFFFPDAQQLADGMEMIATTGISGLLQKTKFFLSHPRSLGVLVGQSLAGAKVRNPLATEYWSQGPYRLGDDESRAVKHLLRPCSMLTEPLPNKDDPDYLRNELDDRLNTYKNPGCFEFFIQEQGDDACANDIEDSVKVWDAPWTRVALVHIDTNQDINSAKVREQCENASFNPWTGVKAHTPLGINRIRKGIYAFSSANRHKLNGASVYHPF